MAITPSRAEDKSSRLDDGQGRNRTADTRILSHERHPQHQLHQPVGRGARRSECPTMQDRAGLTPAESPPSARLFWEHRFKSGAGFPSFRLRAILRQPWVVHAENVQGSGRRSRDFCRRSPGRYFRRIRGLEPRRRAYPRHRGACRVGRSSADIRPVAALWRRRGRVALFGRRDDHGGQCRYARTRLGLFDWRPSIETASNMAQCRRVDTNPRRGQPRILHTIQRSDCA